MLQEPRGPEPVSDPYNRQGPRPLVSLGDRGTAMSEAGPALHQRDLDQLRRSHRRALLPAQPQGVRLRQYLRGTVNQTFGLTRLPSIWKSSNNIVLYFITNDSNNPKNNSYRIFGLS